MIKLFFLFLYLISFSTFAAEGKKTIIKNISEVWANFHATEKRNFRNEINVKLPPFNAVGNNVADDYAAIQGAIDSAVKVYGAVAVYIPAGSFKISKPLIVAKWNPTFSRYDQASVRIYGDDFMWSTGITMIKPTFKNGFALGLHLNKGSIVTGLFFDGKYIAPNISIDSLYRTSIASYGDTSCRDTRYSPYAGIVIDPFRYNIPADGGYPELAAWYRGNNAVSGSTGIRIEDCTVRNFTVSIAVSPNGHTLNAEILSFNHIRINDCKIAFTGCQAQEKGNELFDWGIWGRVRVAFMFGDYGQGKPGNYTITKVNIAGQVVQLLYRYSQQYFPMFMDKIFAENLGFLGVWNTLAGDAMRDATLNFYSPDLLKSFPDNHIEGSGVTYTNVNIRYYGIGNYPMLIKGNNTLINSQSSEYVNHIQGVRFATTDPGYKKGYDLPIISADTARYYFEAGTKKSRFKWFTYQGVTNKVIVNDIVVLRANTDNAYYGMAKVESVDSLGYIVKYLSPGIRNDFRYIVSKYVHVEQPLP